MKRVICKSGINGWQARLQKIYANYEEFCTYNSIYGIALRLGYKSELNAWRKNPTIQGSINPSDFCKVNA